MKWGKLLIEHVGFLLLLLLSILYSEERLLADSGYYFIQVLNSEWFWVEHNRLILILPEFAPLMGMWLGLDLSSLILLYSVGHVLFFYLIYLLASHYGNRLAGAQLLLIQVLGISSGFFVPMFELYYAAGLLILVDSILKRKTQNWKHTLLLSVLVLFIASAHFYAIALLLFILAFRIIETRKWNWIQLLLFAFIIASTMMYKKYHISDYEQGKIDAFVSGIMTYAPTWKHTRELLSFLISYYLEFLLITTISISVLICKKHWLKASLVVVSCFILTVMVTVSYVGFEPSRYQEQVYFPLTFVAAYAFTVATMSASSKNARFALIALAILVFVVRSHGIYQSGQWFTERQNEMSSFISNAQERQGTKFAVHEGLLKHDANWSYPIESLLLSASDPELKTVTICTDVDLDYNDNQLNLKKEQFLFRRYELYELSVLNPNYFRLDTSEYVFLTSLE